MEPDRIAKGRTVSVSPVAHSAQPAVQSLAADWCKFVKDERPGVLVRCLGQITAMPVIGNLALAFSACRSAREKCLSFLSREDDYREKFKADLAARNPKVPEKEISEMVRSGARLMNQVTESDIQTIELAAQQRNEAHRVRAFVTEKLDGSVVSGKGVTRETQKIVVECISRQIEQRLTTWQGQSLEEVAADLLPPKHPHGLSPAQDFHFDPNVKRVVDGFAREAHAKVGLVDAGLAEPSVLDSISLGKSLTFLIEQTRKS